MALAVPGSAAASPPPGGTVVAVGNFDGVHLGHRAVLAAVRARAQALGAAPWVYTFDPAPTAIVAPTRHQPRICTLDTRVRRLGEAGAAAVVVEPFTAAFAAVEASVFATEILGRRLGARAVVVGHDFRFGRGRVGDVRHLAAWLPGVELVEVPALEAEGGPVSSSRIRKLLAAGEVEAAGRLLGQASTLGGPVVHGDGRGRTLGIPTANVATAEELLPAFGVYAVRLRAGAARWDGVCNIGLRPTFAGAVPSVEVHLLDADVDLYDQTVELELVARLRPERRFDGVAALVAQIHADIAAARVVLA